MKAFDAITGAQLPKIPPSPGKHPTFSGQRAKSDHTFFLMEHLMVKWNLLMFDFEL